ncbi:TetR family transcriptional regulator [Streptomyces sp. NPDC054855]
MFAEVFKRLAAAAGLFAVQGINATGMKQIAERAPVSTNGNC